MAAPEHFQVDFAEQSARVWRSLAELQEFTAEHNRRSVETARRHSTGVSRDGQRLASRLELALMCACNILGAAAGSLIGNLLFR